MKIIKFIFLLSSIVLFASFISSYPNDYKKFFEENPGFIADGFQMPVGPPDAKNYYNAQKFGVNLHLGEDWNGVGGGDTDLGDPVYAIANGYISEVKDHKGGWCKIVRIIHKMPEGHEFEYVESLYAHLDEFNIKVGSSINKGDQIGTIGNCDGAYLAHLHLELRHKVEMPTGPGYSSNTEGFLKPTEFIKANK